MRAKGVRLVPSERMSERGEAEESYIRIPRRARLYFDSRGERIVISVGKTTEVLNVRPAYQEDVAILKEELKSGVITLDDLQSTGFVTHNTLKKLSSTLSPSDKKEVDKYSFLTDGIEDIKIGADPEFALINPETLRFQYAEHLNIMTKSDELGHDGPLAELRPPPETSIEDFVRNIRNILKRDGGKVDKFKWLGGAAYCPPDRKEEERIVQIGGHIQFGNPLLLPDSQDHSIYSRVTRILDEIIALPLVRIDTPLPEYRRNNKWMSYGPYGVCGDFKPKENRFEWRVPSGIWLVHPDIAQPVLGASKAVVEACYQLMADKDFKESWICAPEDSKGFLKSWGVLEGKKLEELINKADRNAVELPLINRAAKKLKELDTYDKYKAEIDEFIRLVRLQEKDIQNINLDLKDSWLNNGKLITGEK